MTASLDRGPALISDLENDAKYLAHNEQVSEEQARRVMGRIGLLLCDVARNAVSNEEAREIAVFEAEKVAKAQIDGHVIICKAGQISPTSFRGAALIALSRCPWAIAMIIVVLILRPGAMQALQKILP